MEKKRYAIDIVKGQMNAIENALRKSHQEKKKEKQGHCTKCGDAVIGKENSMCFNCAK